MCMNLKIIALMPILFYLQYVRTCLWSDSMRIRPYPYPRYLAAINKFFTL